MAAKMAHPPNLPWPSSKPWLSQGLETARKTEKIGFWEENTPILAIFELPEAV